MPIFDHLNSFDGIYGLTAVLFVAVAGAFLLYRFYVLRH